MGKLLVTWFVMGVPSHMPKHCLFSRALLEWCALIISITEYFFTLSLVVPSSSFSLFLSWSSKLIWSRSCMGCKQSKLSKLCNRSDKHTSANSQSAILHWKTRDWKIKINKRRPPHSRKVNTHSLEGFCSSFPPIHKHQPRALSSLIRRLTQIYPNKFTL